MVKHIGKKFHGGVSYTRRYAIEHLAIESVFHTCLQRDQVCTGHNKGAGFTSRSYFLFVLILDYEVVSEVRSVVVCEDVVSRWEGEIFRDGSKRVITALGVKGKIEFEAIAIFFGRIRSEESEHINIFDLHIIIGLGLGWLGRLRRAFELSELLRDLQIDVAGFDPCACACHKECDEEVEEFCHSLRRYFV